jgi:hypothetical protein
MQSHRTLCLAWLLCSCALGYSALGYRALGFSPLAGGQAPGPPRESVSSDDISVADGLQLPTFGHVWALDTWKGMHELVRLRPPNSTSDEPVFGVKMRRSLEFKGEAAIVRVHDAAPLFFLRGVSGADNGRSDLVVVRLSLEGQRREVSKDALAQIKEQAKHADAQYPALIRMKQQRVGTTDWYRLTPQQALSTGEYALIPLPASPGFADGEVFDFAIDPDAPENSDPLRSEQYRGAQ